MPRLRSFYLENERAILGTSAVVLVLLVWEGLSQGWWLWRIEPVFLSPQRPSYGPALASLRPERSGTTFA